MLNYVEKVLIVLSLSCNVVTRKAENIYFISVLKQKVKIIEKLNYV